MSEREFLEVSAKTRAAQAIRAVEAVTTVEVVVAVRHRASRHVGTSLAFGVACALVGFGFMWWSPWVFDVDTMPLDAALAFVVGTALCAASAPLRRALTPRAFLQRSAERAARAAFSALGIDKTRGRTGLLVYVALFERTVVLVPDSGIPDVEERGTLTAVGYALGAAVGRLDWEGFLVELGRLGPICAATLPRQAGDENELCDEVV